MKRQVGLNRTSVLTVALLSSAACFLIGAPAQAADMPVKAMPAAAPVPYWWFHGTIEAGGRFFLNDPQRNGSVYLGQNSLAKYYEYTDIRPGAFANFDISAGTSDGLYEFDVGGKNVGYDDQSYYLDFSQAGNLYVSGGWDQSPHLYSTSAQTFYQGVGTSSLTLPPGFVKCTAPGSGTCPTGPLYTTDIGIKRDTGSASIRWTPDGAWDLRADYSHMHRHGTQYDGVAGFGPSFGYGPTEVPRPVDDTTQNYGVNGEYVGTSPWGQAFNFKLAYKGSNYDDSLSGYTIQDPFSNGANQPGTQLTTWPSNRSDAVSGTLGANLPWNSRYVGMVDYTMMRQNATFQTNPYDAALYAASGSFPSSLNGAINTLLSNNILTTQITPELSSKLMYRYYDFNNDTPEIQFLNKWVDQVENTANATPISSLSMGYIKQDASADLNWRPTRSWNVGAGYGWERYNWTRADADVTNEGTGRVHADWQPTSWFQLRSSASYSSRRYDNYDYYAFVCDTQWVTACTPGTGYSTAYRQFFLDNRDRWKTNIEADVVVVPGLTVTPSFKYQDDHYGLDKYSESGLTDSRGYATGVDVTYLVSPGASITLGYLREYYTQLVDNCNCDTHGSPAGNPTPANFLETNDKTTVDTFTALARWAAIPDTLDLSLRYAVSRGVDHQQVNAQYSTNPLTGGQFPDVTTWFQRLDATAVYTFDKDTIAKLGWHGKVKAKLHYVWERNSVSNWSNDTITPYDPSFASGAYSIFLASDNPNYNVHMLMASLAFQW
jgi:MtrB/PioB family decaheme-associated outer membrane protein